MARKILTGEVDFSTIEELSEFKGDAGLMNIVLSALRRCYPDSFEIKVVRVTEKKISFNVTIHFPVIEITNRNNKKHIIRDILVRFPVDVLDNGMVIGSLTGTRTSFTRDELISNYTHSHLAGNSDHSYGPWRIFLESRDSRVVPNDVDESRAFTSFCLGHGGIGKLIMVINSSFEKQRDINNWILFLRSIKAYLSYESLEGGPYRRMGDIGANQSIGGYHYDSTQELHHIYDVLISLLSYKKEIFDAITDLVKKRVITLLLNSEGEIYYFHTPEVEVSLCSAIGRLTLIPKYNRRKTNSSYVYSRGGRLGIDITESKLEKLRNCKLKFRDSEIQCKLIDFEKVTTIEPPIEAYHPSTVRTILNFYVTVCNRKRKALASSKCECETPSSDF